ncbi:MAG: thioredoxin [Bacteroidota bacterium]
MTQAITPNTIEVTDANFAAIIQGGQPVLIDFWAAWCGPCRVIAPIIEELAQETVGQFVIGKLDVDKNPSMSTKYGVRSIPTLIIFKNGQEVDRLLGAQYTKDTLRAKLAMHAE